MIRKAIQRDKLCEGSQRCPEARIQRCSECFTEYGQELGECPECHGWRAQTLRCPECPQAWLDSQLDTFHGRLLRRALDLMFFAGQHMPIDEPTAEEALVIRMVESERSKLEEQERQRHEAEMKARRQ